MNLQQQSNKTIATIVSYIILVNNLLLNEKTISVRLRMHIKYLYIHKKLLNEK